MSQAISEPAIPASATMQSVDASGAQAIEKKHDVVLSDSGAIMDALATDPDTGRQEASSDAHPDGGQSRATEAEDQHKASGDSEAGLSERHFNVPQSWAQDAKEQFAQLPPDLQRFVAKREAERESLISVKATELEKARQAEANLAQYAQTHLAHALARAQAAIEGEFAGINWLELKKQDPNAWAQLDAMRQERLQAVDQAMRQHQMLAQIAQQKQQQETARRYEEQAKAVIPEIAKIVGDGFEQKAWATAAVAYLKNMGCPEAHINGITDGYQLQLVAKAMQFDALTASADAAKQKIATAPKMLVPDSSVAASAGMDAKKQAALAALRKNPKDTDAIAAALALGM